MTAASVALACAALQEQLVGRDEEIAALVAAIEDARAGIPTLTIVEGPPGSGKSTLLRTAVALSGDVTSLVASGAETERMLDLGVVDQLLAEAEAEAAGLGEARTTPRHRSRPEPFELGRRLVGCCRRRSVRTISRCASRSTSRRPRLDGSGC